MQMRNQLKCRQVACIRGFPTALSLLAKALMPFKWSSIKVIANADEALKETAIAHFVVVFLQVLYILGNVHCKFL